MAAAICDLPTPDGLLTRRFRMMCPVSLVFQRNDLSLNRRAEFGQNKVGKLFPAASPLLVSIFAPVLITICRFLFTKSDK